MSNELIGSNLPFDVDDPRLKPPEIFWRDHQPWLLKSGYQLRPRFQPGWKASWTGTGVSRLDCEDGIPLRRAITMCDATRISDNSYVALKLVKVSVHPNEKAITEHFSSKPLSDDPKNHCIPLIESLVIPDDTDKIILVLPLLREWDLPRFETVGEGVDFFKQLFEGVQFMHKHHTAHRDISLLNIMMDGAMYPQPWHPVRDYETRDLSAEIKPYSRTQRPPRYYLIDFGISSMYDPNDPSPLEWVHFGGDKSVPEFKNPDGKYNPFPIDVYYVGNIIREGFLQEYTGFAFMENLVSQMVQDDPTKRPNMNQVVEQFEAIHAKMGAFQLRSPAGDKEKLFRGIRDNLTRIKLIFLLMLRK